MRIQILGSGCAKCNDLYANAVQAVGRAPGGDHTVTKVDDVDEFFRLGVTRTPALVFDDEVVSSGTVLSADEIVALIQSRGGSE